MPCTYVAMRWSARGRPDDGLMGTLMQDFPPRRGAGIAPKRLLQEKGKFGWGCAGAITSFSTQHQNLSQSDMGKQESNSPTIHLAVAVFGKVHQK